MKFYHYAAYSIDKNGYRLSPLYVETALKLKKGDIVHDCYGSRIEIDFLIEELGHDIERTNTQSGDR